MSFDLLFPCRTGGCWFSFGPDGTYVVDDYGHLFPLSLESDCRRLTLVTQPFDETEARYLLAKRRVSDAEDNLWSARAELLDALPPGVAS